MRKFKKRIEIMVKDIVVGERYYRFYYEVRVDGRLVEDDTYFSSHSRSPKSIRRWLTKGNYAEELIMQKIYG